jgi:D-sedoheptulose 7-phosphate isomerase
MTPSRRVHGMAEKLLAEMLREHRDAIDRLGAAHVDGMVRMVQDIEQAWRNGGKLLVCGNGGSAADSQHLAAELTGRYRHDRIARPALALTTDTSALTAISNDYGFEHVFARQIEALGRPGDVLLVISTSGNSPNCITAAHKARAMGLRCHGLLGRNGGDLLGLVDSAVVAPSDDTPRIQEVHGLFIHWMCEMIEAGMRVKESRGE